MSTKPAHSPTPWKVAPGLHGEAHICLEDGTVVLQSTTRGGLPASSNALHAAACVNGTDARTVALADALEVARAFINVIGFDSEVSNNVQAKIRAALALL